MILKNSDQKEKKKEVLSLFYDTGKKHVVLMFLHFFSIFKVL